MAGFLGRTAYSEWLKRFFEYPIQKLAVDAGFTCPNRDGSKGRGGCTFCSNQVFSPSYTDSALSVSEQLSLGKRFFRRKISSQTHFFAYFQTYSNTYAPIDRLRALYEEALSVENVCGLVIATRPDCLSTEIISYLSELSRTTFVQIELGVETTDNEILKNVNRGHDFACTKEALLQLSDSAVHVGVHLIFGLPGSTADQILSQAELLNPLPFEILKLHQLQIVKGTVMAKQYRLNPDEFALFSPESYLSLVKEFLQKLRSDIVLDRIVSQIPPFMVVAPRWGLSPEEFNRLMRHI